MPHARIVRIDISRALALPGRPRRADRQGLPDRLRHPAGEPGRARALRPTASASSATRSPRSPRATRLTAFDALDLIDVDVRAAAHLSPIPRTASRIRSRASTTTATPATSTSGLALDSATSSRLRRRRPVFEDTVLLRGQHASADRAARRGRGRRIPTASSGALVEHADAALRASRARQGARDAGGAHPRHRHAERRRLRRQERSVQSRDRRRASWRC